MKSLLSLKGLAIIDWVATRLERSALLDAIVFALPDSPLDDVLAAHLHDRGRRVERGPEADVLRRFALAAEAADAGAIVRVCADNPLIDGACVDGLIDFYRQERPDYAYNHIPRGNLWPDGLGAEIVSRELLDEMDRKASAPEQREHALNYVWDNSASYRIATFDPADPTLRRPDLKLDVDSAEDFARLALAPISVDSSPIELARIFPPEE